MSLFTELKRRHVFKVGAAYLVVGWVMIEVASTVAPHLNLPEWAPRFITFVVLLGFPIAMVLAWIFDLTPEGVQVTEGKAGSRRFYAVVAVLTAVGLAIFLRSESDSVAPPSAAEGRSSIAVLAFANMSPDPDNAYFAEGISEELLNILAGIEGLHVASRTSAFAFRGANTSIPEIARLLDVAHVLEGSVRKQGNRVRITAQLIRTDTDGHLWSQTYDRDVTDIFAVQEEIAQEIADALGDILGMRQISVVASTEQLDAYDRFLRGRARFHHRIELDKAVEDLQYAVTQDPGFADAWIYLAAVYHVSIGYLSGQNIDDPQSGLILALERASELAPEDPLVLALRGRVISDAGDKVSAMALLERAASLRVRDSTPVLWYGLQLLYAGYRDEALAVLERAHRMDPMAGINHGYLAYAYINSGDLAAGERHALMASGRDWPLAAISLSFELADRGDHAHAVELFSRVPSIGTGGSIGFTDEDREILIGVLSNPENANQRIYPGEAMVYLGRTEELFDNLGQRQSSIETRMEFWLRYVWMPFAHAVREHPRFFTLAGEIGLVDLWERRGYPTGCMRLQDEGADRLLCLGMAP